MTPPAHAQQRAASDASHLDLLNALPLADREAFLTAAEHTTTIAAQDYLIARHRIAVSVSALESWLHRARQDRRTRRFDAFLSSLRADVEQAQQFCRLIDTAASLERANAFVLSCKLFEALQTGDRSAILDFAHALAATLPAVAPASPLPEPGAAQADPSRRPLPGH